MLREEELAQELPRLAERLGRSDPAAVPAPMQDAPYTLDQIYNPDLEALCRSIYTRDYLGFGFGDWA